MFINLSCLVILFTLALMNQYSALMISHTLFYKHLVKTCVGFVVLLSTFLIDEETLEKSIPLFYILILGVLLLVLFKGTTIKGATRWISFYRFSFQPSEVAKIIVPLMSAHVIFYTKNSPLWISVLLTLLVALVPGYLVAKQPDLGSSILVLYSGLIPLTLVNIPRRYFITVISLILLCSPFLWQLLHPYQQQRIQTLFSPTEDLQGAGYHINQSKIAIGSGLIMGKGWSNNTQAYLGYLPESDTDFAFALYAEERGAIVTVITIVLLYIFYMTLIQISLSPQKEYLKLICFSLAAPQFLYCFINIAMISGIIPVVGVPLPFFSRGGSSFLIQMLTLGMIYRFTLKQD